mmetsp:Transcript_12970/g.24818  ORF Transcript_12970/g.24818 Transcript_12970/m.24818 type:complete len:188 (-) Transcript_12970:290-853(-)|eukprot:CAMPEP_0170184272 /NCGR_PEP_ID=MMETSP0040_2-20121228/33148_1 /TAXON_ID=641309 /ORGANISM="Lotharella oceanica, Strain CCMP622" /LENGTH=187 /DNA_ID=CAMNT_0010430265 /DNA_START=23 /DNA_END=586 /DNA_ORIENTATION=+
MIYERWKGFHDAGVWIGLDDVTKDSGCLWYVPGSHRWGLLPMTGLSSDMDSIRKVLSPEQQQIMDETKVPAELPKGFAAIHHPLMVHGSYGNTSMNQRRATVVNVMQDGCLSNVGDRDMGGFPRIDSEEPMDGPYFPLLVDRDEERQMREGADGVMNPPCSLDLGVFEAELANQRALAERTSYRHEH